MVHMDSTNMLKKLGVDPETVLEQLSDEERALLDGEAIRIGISVIDLIALQALHDLTPSDLRAAEAASAALWSN